MFSQDEDLLRRRRWAAFANVLNKAVAYWDPRFYSGSGDLLDLSGRGHDAQLGSVGGADSNDPLFLSYTDAPYIYLPGIDGANATIPDAPSLSVIGDIDLQWYGALDDWSPAAANGLVEKDDIGSNRDYGLYIVGTSLRFLKSANGTSVVVANATVSTGFTDGTLHWVRVTYKASTGDVKFFDGGTAATPSWSKMGETVPLAATAIHDGSSVVAIGSFSNGLNPALGYACRAIIKDGIDGTTVLDLPFNDITKYNAIRTELTGVSDQAHTATINRPASGRKTVIVERSTFLLGTDDFFEIADSPDLDFAADESLTLAVVVRLYGTTADQVLIAKKQDLVATAGFSLDRGTANAPPFMIADGVAAPEDIGPAITQGLFFVVAGVRNVGDDDVEAFTRGVGSGSPTTDTTTLTLANALPLRIGASSHAVPASFGDFEFIGAAIFREALSDGDVLRLNQAFRV
jgi:hypothetical protein